MLKNFFITTARNLIKNKSYAAINIVGLSLGIICALIIFSIIWFEKSFDTHQQNYERIYRLVRTVDRFGKTSHDTGVPYPLPAALWQDFPEIEALTIIDCNFDSPVIAVDTDQGSIPRFREEKSVAFVENAFFRIFTYEWLRGSPEAALAEPHTAVISEGLAHKYFGDADPMGRRLRYDNRIDFQIVGVVKDAPQNSDIPFNLLLAYDTAYRGDDNWSSSASSVQCYFVLPSAVLPEPIEARLPAFCTKYLEEDAAKATTFSLQSMATLHFDTRFGTFAQRTVSEETLLALALIGLALLLTACINFVNLNTAIAVRRSKEVGLRKVLGSSRLRLIAQFLGETACITLIAIGLAGAFGEMVAGTLAIFLGYSLNLDPFSNQFTLVFLLVLFVVVTLAAGYYPALHLSRFSPIEAIRNKLTTRYAEGISLRKSLVVLQFAISQALILSALVVGLQLNYMRNVDMGFRRDAVVEVELPTREDEKLHRFKAELVRHAAITQVSFSNTGAASTNSWGGNYTLIDSAEAKRGYAHVKFVDEHFIETYDVELLAGEPLLAGDTLKRFLVNQAFVEEAGYGIRYHDILGKQAKIWGREALIGGVIKNFNTTSLHDKITPVMIMLQNRYMIAGIGIDMARARQALQTIESAWTSVYPQFVFSYAFLDESIAEFYEDEQRTAILINVFTGIAILIGCLGLYGLVSYMALQRTKEIGVRKVLGATFSHILALFSREFTVLVLIAFVFAMPVAYYLMNSWLSEFAYRISLSWELFFYALAVSFAIAFATVGYKSIRAALANPVDSLRHE